MKLIFLGTGHGSATPTHISSVTYLETAGKSYLVDCADGRTDELEKAVTELDGLGDVTKEACFVRDSVLPKMAALRAVCDEAETLTAASYWPFPTYGDLLFGV